MQVERDDFRVKLLDHIVEGLIEFIAIDVVREFSADGAIAVVFNTNTVAEGGKHRLLA